MIEINTIEKEIRINELSDLYGVMQSFAEIKPKNFNLEGAIYSGKEWYLLNRGNGEQGKNIVFTLQGKNLIYEFNILSNNYKIKNELQLSIEIGISTMMACPGNLEQEFSEVLNTADNISTDGKTLTLNKARMAPLARFELVIE